VNVNKDSNNNVTINNQVNNQSNIKESIKPEIHNYESNRNENSVIVEESHVINNQKDNNKTTDINQSNTDFHLYIKQLKALHNI